MARKRKGSTKAAPKKTTTAKLVISEVVPKVLGYFSANTGSVTECARAIGVKRTREFCVMVFTLMFVGVLELVDKVPNYPGSYPVKKWRIKKGGWHE